MSQTFVARFYFPRNQISIVLDCCFQLTHAVAGKTELFENVNIDWNLISDEHVYELDYSDDDLDAGSQVSDFFPFSFVVEATSERSPLGSRRLLFLQTPDRKARSRPGSIVMDSTMPLPLKPHHQGHVRNQSLPGPFRDHVTGPSKGTGTGTLPPPPPKPGKVPVQPTKLQYDSNTLPYASTLPGSMSASMTSSTLPHTKKSKHKLFNFRKNSRSCAPKEKRLAWSFSWHLDGFVS